MNHSMPAPEAMTDLGRLLAGPQGEHARNRLLRILADEEMRVRRQMNAGLDAGSYARADRRILALQHAEAVLKSLSIFLEP